MRCETFSSVPPLPSSGLLIRFCTLLPYFTDFQKAVQNGVQRRFFMPCRARCIHLNGILSPLCPQSPLAPGSPPSLCYDHLFGGLPLSLHLDGEGVQNKPGGRMQEVKACWAPFILMRHQRILGHQVAAKRPQFPWRRRQERQVQPLAGIALLCRRASSPMPADFVCLLTHMHK